MIPADVASQLRLVTPDLPAPVQPVTPAKQITDILGDLVPGQRLLAEVQMLLPNGTYRAMVAQREVTLALPFSAKPGDSLELEVVETDGKISLAFLANRTTDAPANKADSVPTRLSSTGQLIGNLLNDIEADGGQRAKPAALNNNQPLVAKMPTQASELVPVLQNAISKSGLFFESHQAQWVAGKINTADLLDQPQGRLSQIQNLPLRENAHAHPLVVIAKGDEPTALQQAAVSETVDIAKSSALNVVDKTVPQTRPPGIPPEILPIVQQQLDGLSTQSFLWQGQIWPGQTMEWEIIEQDDSRRDTGIDDAARWSTRLKLTLPSLGGIEATLTLRSANEIEISLKAADDAQGRLRAEGPALHEQLQNAGLTLNALMIGDGEST